MKRLQGTITQWNDDKGFGFITSEKSNEKIFVHISAFEFNQRRPKLKDTLSFMRSTDGRGRVRAQQAALTGNRVNKDWKSASSLLLVFSASLFILSVLVLVIRKHLPFIVFYGYFILSAITFVAYRLDKYAAEVNNWRTKESRLHVLSLIGGWPGALVAQQIIRHKSRKIAFQVVFWITVLVNGAGFSWLFSHEGQNLVWFANEQVVHGFIKLGNLIQWLVDSIKTF